MTAKREMLARLAKIVEGLESRGYQDEALKLRSVAGSLRSIPKDATIQEVVRRTLDATVRHEVTLDGRLVDVLAYLAKSHGVSLAMHPVMMLIITLGGRNNPDRIGDDDSSARLDALLSTLIEEKLQYQEALYVVATLARQSGLEATADMAIELMNQIHDMGAESISEQAAAVEAGLAHRPAAPNDDDLGWVVKLMLTLASLAAVAAVATRLTGSIQDLIGALDAVVGAVGGGEP